MVGDLYAAWRENTLAQYPEMAEMKLASAVLQAIAQVIVMVGIYWVLYLYQFRILSGLGQAESRFSVLLPNSVAAWRRRCSSKATKTAAEEAVARAMNGLRPLQLLPEMCPADRHRRLDQFKHSAACAALLEVVVTGSHRRSQVVR